MIDSKRRALAHFGGGWGLRRDSLANGTLGSPVLFDCISEQNAHIANLPTDSSIWILSQSPFTFKHIIMSEMQPSKAHRHGRGKRGSWAPGFSQDVAPPSYDYVDGISPGEKGKVMSSSSEVSPPFVL